MDFDAAALFGLLLPSRAINTPLGEKSGKLTLRGTAPLPPSEILMRDPLTNLRSISPKECLMDLMTGRTSL